MQPATRRLSWTKFRNFFSPFSSFLYLHWLRGVCSSQSNDKVPLDVYFIIYKILLNYDWNMKEKENEIHTVGHSCQLTGSFLVSFQTWYTAIDLLNSSLWKTRITTSLLCSVRVIKEWIDGWMDGQTNWWIVEKWRAKGCTTERERNLIPKMIGYWLMYSLINQ